VATRQLTVVEATAAGAAAAAEADSDALFRRRLSLTHPLRRSQTTGFYPSLLFSSLLFSCVNTQAIYLSVCHFFAFYLSLYQNKARMKNPK
jgi:hypothetical protein